MKIIGIDSAVQDKNIGMVLCDYSQGRCIAIEKWHHHLDSYEQIIAWIGNENTLLAIDSPLGWPKQFSDTLKDHKAGEYLESNEVSFFKRETDSNIKTRYKKNPLEISADKIARTAYFTLKRLEELRLRMKKKIEIVWDYKEEYEVGFIEVYPACTLLANNLEINGYKNDISKRNDLYKRIENYYNVINDSNIDFVEVEHDFDALICCLSGIDFLSGNSMGVDKLNSKVMKEGWIWCR